MVGVNRVRPYGVRWWMGLWYIFGNMIPRSTAIHRGEYLIYRGEYLIYRGEYLIHRGVYLIHRGVYLVYRSEYLVYHHAFQSVGYK